MDPDECMRQLRKLLEKYKRQKDHLNGSDVMNLVIHIEAIDGWMTKGGFLPETWNTQRNEQVKDFEAIVSAKKQVAEGLAQFNDENPEFPEKLSIEGFYDAVRLLVAEGRLK